MLRRIILIAVLLPAAFAAAQQSDTTYTYTTISDPHATAGTEAVRVNNTGDVIGVYATMTVNGFPTFGFLDVDNAFTTIHPPGAGRTKALGINSSGEVVGFYRTCSSVCSSSDPDIGFIYNKNTGDYSIIKSPSKTFSSIQLIGVNDAGTIVGSLLQNPSDDCTAGSTVCRGGFIYQDGKFITTSLVAFGSPYTIATDISNSGEVVGIYYNTTTKQEGGFSYVDGKYTRVNAPGAKSTYVFGISPTTGVMVGVFTNSSGDKEAFVDDKGKFTTTAFPGSKPYSTNVFGINDNGDLTGSYKNSKNVAEGFLAKP
jgi:hypothetical protein